MKEFLYMIVGWIAEIHSYLMRFNDSYEYNFSDKELHFIVIGLLGFCIQNLTSGSLDVTFSLMKIFRFLIIVI